MIVEIIVKDVPGQGDVRFPADLTIGFIGPSIVRVMQQAFESKLIGDVNFSTIRKVQLHSDSSITGEVIALIEEDIVPGGIYSVAPVLQVHCDWEEEEDELDRAYEKAGIQFGDSTVKPMVACPLAQAAEKGAPSELEDETPPAEQQPPKHIKVYFTTALIEQYRGGDADFMKACVDGLHLIGIDAVRIINSNLKMGAFEENLLTQNKLVTLDYYEGLSPEQKEYTAKNYPLQRDTAVKCMIRFLRQEKAADPTLIQILNIQSRLPGTGSAFKLAETIKQFRDADVSVFVTVHEWLYNKHHIQARSDDIEKPTLAICKASDGAIFVNDLDQIDSGIESAFIPVPITVAFETIDIEAVLQRPVRILMFGMLRQNKGFEKAKDLGELLADRYDRDYDNRKPPIEQKWNVWVTGKLLESYSNFLGLVRDVYGDTIYEQVFGDKTLLGIYDGEGESNDDDFNSAVSALLAQCEEHRSALMETKQQRKELADKLIRFRDQLLKINFGRDEAPHFKDTGPFKKQLEIDDIWNHNNAAAIEEFIGEQDIETGIKKLNTYLAVDVFKNASDEISRSYLTQFQGIDHAADTAHKNIFSQFVQARTKNDIDNRIKDLLYSPLPVFFKLNLSDAEAVDTFKACKYVYKPDDKGLADNASAMISPMANGCILFTKLGKLTPAEFIEGGHRAPQEVPPERFKLDFAGSYSDAVCLGEQDENIGPENVIAEIERREQEGNPANRITLERLKHLTEHRYLPITIAARMIIYMRRKLRLPNLAVIPNQEQDL